MSINRKGFKKLLKNCLALILCISLLMCCAPSLSAAAMETEKSFTRLYDYNELAAKYLSGEGDSAKEYPNGAFMLPLSSAQLNMEEFYALEVFREGGTSGDASITLKTVDMTARYGEDYRLFLSRGTEDPPVDGEANPYYDMEQYSFIAERTQREVVCASNEDENVAAIRQSASEYNDSILDGVMPVSSEFTLDFADGENSKTIYIQTYKKKEVTANLDFTLNLCNPENASIGVQTSCAFTIIEDREKPETYLALNDGIVNPKSDEAYLVVSRTGNMGTTGSFTVKTQSSTAKAGEAYEAVYMPLQFLPGMAEIKVPVAILSGARDGSEFKACLEDVKVAEVKNEKATVAISSLAPIEDAHQTTFNLSDEYVASGSSIVNTDTGVRGKQIIDASQFSQSTVTDRGTGSQDHGYKKDGSDMKLEYDNNWSSSNNCISVRSKEKINFTGVDSITIAIDNFTGSTVSDDQLLYVADSDKFKSDTSNYDWVDHLDGVGDSWVMTNISDSFIRNTANLDQSKVKGEHYLYLALHKGAVVGYAGYKVYNRGASDVDHNIQLNMTKYNITVIEPDAVPIYVDGKLVDTQVAKNHQLVDPASMHDNDRNTGTSFSIYRDETTAISAITDSKFNGLVKLEGVYFCESGKTSNHSELYKLDSDSFTLTSEILEKYSSYIKDKKIVIQPVYSVSDSALTVESFENTKTGQKFVADNASCKGDFYYNGSLVGTLSWTESTRDKGNYVVGDSLKFSFAYADSAPLKHWAFKLDTRAASTEALLSTADIITKNTGTFEIDLQLTDLYFSVTPSFTITDTTTLLNVTNPDMGTFSGKGGKYAVTNSDGSVTLSGYSSDDGAADTVFTDMSVNEIITFHAEPKDGYRARWSYSDSASHQIKTYYGDSFFFAVQNPYYADDNHVILTFEKLSDNSKSVLVYGQTLLQEGTVINPPTSSTDTYNLVSGAQITMSSYSALSDENGEFMLQSNPGGEDSKAAEISVAPEETHRALVFYNNQYYICDIDMSQYITSENSITVPIKMNYRTNGVMPKSIYACSSDGTAYGDTITLITANAVQFDMTIDTKGQSASKPVNLVRWTVENDDGIKSTYDVELKSGETVSHWANTLSEIMKQGDKLFAELMCKDYDDDANAVYSSYGKFDTGYKFIATSVTDTITYAPDIGAPSTMSQPIPVLGPVSPTFSIKGFTPIINTGTAGTDKDGHEINTITIGFSFGKAKDLAAQDPKWGTASPLDKAKGIADVLSKFDAAKNSNGGLPKNAAGKVLGNALNMKTAVKLSFSVTLCYQGNYFVDDKGEWEFVGNLLVAGAGGSIRVSIPFVLCYIPCFAYFTASININMYLGVFANTDAETGESVALTLDQLDDAEASTFQGVYELKIGLGAGVGVGFDGLLSASGGVDFTFDIQFNDFMRGYGTVGMKGSISLELLFLKATWSDDFFKTEMFNTLGDATGYDLKSLQAQIETDLLKNTTVGDMIIATAEAQEGAISTNLRAAVKEEKIVDGTPAPVNPEVISIGNGKYLIVSTAKGGDTSQNNVLHYYIYDEKTDRITESAPVLKKAVEDNYGTETEEALNKLTADYRKIDHDAVMTDCGDDILIAWNKCMVDAADNDKLLNSVGIATVYYNKESGKFHDYNVIFDRNKKYMYMTPQLAYNSQTDTSQVFFQAMNTEKLTLDTTLEEIQSYPTALMTSYCNTTDKKWSESKTVAINGEYLKYFDAAAYEDKIMLSYVASDTCGFTLDSTEEFDIESNFDASKFDTDNSLYIQQFNTKDGALASDNPIRITADGYVTANPKFAQINADGVSNTLLFYKCNGLYAYQNITNIIANGLYKTENGELKITDAYVEPQFITDKEDYTVNDDFTVYSNTNGDIYALWTTTESNQQQIWAKQFVFDRMDKVTQVGSLDSNGRLVYDGSGNPVMTKLETPLYLLNGYWGGKTYLTEKGIYGSDETGLYKDNFTAAVLPDGDLLTVFNAYDREISEGGCKYVNNMLVVAEYDSDSDYRMPSEIDAIEFSNEYPTGGETINVTCHAENLGVKSGRNVTVTLYVNGEEYDSITESVWLSGDAKAFDFYYTLPKGVSGDDVSMYYTITENGENRLACDTFTLKQGADLSITMLKLSPVKLIDGSSDSTKLFVRATVKNIGNSPYAGGDYIVLTDVDTQEMCKATEDGYTPGKPVYTAFGKEKIGAVDVGGTAEISFISDDIPSSVFEKTGTDTAYLEGIISDKNEANWKTRRADEELSIISEFYPGLTSKPVPETAQSLSIDDITVSIDEPQKLSKSVVPVSSLVNSKVKYTSSDESVATVDDFGVVTGHKEGGAVISAEIDGVTDTAAVTVVGAKAPAEPSDENPAGDNGTAENTDGTKPADSQNGTADTDDAAVQTGGILMTVILLILIAAAFASFLITKKRNKE